MIITAPQEYNIKPFDRVLFLAGTIDNGESEDWQAKVAKRLSPKFNLILNPRRKNWNPDASEKELVEQIRWELEGLENADVVLFNFLPDSKSPVTMLELGMALIAAPNVIIVCPKEFHRYTNVLITAEWNGYSVYHTLEEMYASHGW